MGFPSAAYLSRRQR